MTTYPSLQQLHRAIALKEQIAALEEELAAIFGGNGVRVRRGRKPRVAAAAPKRRRKVSAAVRKRLAAAARARWAKAKASGKSTLAG